MTTTHDFLSLLWPTDTPAIIIVSQRYNEKWKVLGAFRPHEIGSTIRGVDIYYSIGGYATPPKQGRGTAAEVRWWPALFADLDHAGPHHAAPDLPPDYATTRRILDALPLPPSIVVRTGGGVHAYWLLTEPYEIEDEEDRQYVAAISRGWQRVIQATAQRLGGWRVDDVGDLARVARLPGSINSKGGERVEVLGVHPSRRYQLWDFEQYIADIAELDETAERRRSEIVEEYSDGRPIPQGRRNEVVFRLLAAVRAKGADEAALRDEAARLNARCTPPLSDRELASIIKSVLRYPAGPSSIRPLTAWEDAKIAAEALGESIMWSADEGWLLWDGKRWRTDEADLPPSLVSRVREVVRRTREQELSAAEKRGQEGEKLAQALRSHLRRLDGAALLREICFLLRSHIRRAEDVEWDSLTHLNTPGGLIDLHTGNIARHTPMMRVRRITGCEIAPQSSSAWLAFLRELFEGDNPATTKARINWLQVALGSALVGGGRAGRRLIWIYGPPAVGKSVMVDVLDYILGDYLARMPYSSLTALASRRGGEMITSGLELLEGRRIVVTSEALLDAASDSTLAEDIIKTITGDEVIPVRPLYRPVRMIRVDATVVVVGNYPPRLSALSDAAWERLKILPTRDTPIPSDARRHDLRDILRREGPGILRWLIDGAIRYQKEGLEDLAEMAVYRYQARLEGNPLAGWILECCDLDPDCEVSADDARFSYSRWCDQHGEKPLSDRKIGRYLAALGVQIVRRTAPNGRKVRYYRGLHLID